MVSKLLAIATAGILSAGIASASTLTVDFDSGVASGGTYVESGFTFTSNVGTASLANNCPTGVGGANTSCLQFGNNEIITVTYMGGQAFDVLGFVFNGPGNGGDILVAGGGLGETLVETNNGNTMTPAVLTNSYAGIFSFTFQNGANGSGRVDDIRFSVPTPSSVPLPAGGVLLLTAVGAMVARSRKKAA